MKSDREPTPAHQSRKRALITGGTGFVGANLARRLLRDGHEVHLLVRPEHTGWRIDAIRNEVSLHVADLSDRERVGAALQRIRPDWVFHLAAYGAYSWQTDLQQMVRTNVTGTVHLLEAALATGFESFVHGGSSSEYGFKDHAPTEEERLEPSSDYAVTKACATLFCCSRARASGANVVTLRLYSVYGPYEDPNRLIPSLMLHGLAGRFPPLADPDTARDFVFVEDVLDACVVAATQTSAERGAIYNVGSGSQTSLREAVSAIQTLLRIDAEPAWGSMPDRSWDTRTWRADGSRIARELGWRPACSLADGLSTTLEWLRTDAELLAFYRRRLAIPE